jgi:hypothetical protein
MLPLDDSRWNELTTFFEDSAYLTRFLAEWIDATGFDQERDIYSQCIFNLFLHQGTITNSAFAVAPYLLQVCADERSSYSIEYLRDIAYIEANRLTRGLYYNRPGTMEYPAWLMTDYHAVIAQCRNIAEDTIYRCDDSSRTRELVNMLPALHGNGELAWARR